MREGLGDSRGQASRSGDRRFRVTAARDDRAVASQGVTWTPAHKDSGSRQNGWELLRERLKNMMKPEGLPLFVFNTCRQFIRTVPVLHRDEVDRDDVDPRAEDHAGDESRYRLMSKEQMAVARQI